MLSTPDVFLNNLAFDKGAMLQQFLGMSETARKCPLQANHILILTQSAGTLLEDHDVDHDSDSDPDSSRPKLSSKAKGKRKQFAEVAELSATGDEATNRAGKKREPKTKAKAKAKAIGKLPAETRSKSAATVVSSESDRPLSPMLEDVLRPSQGLSEDDDIPSPPPLRSRKAIERDLPVSEDDSPPSPPLRRQGRATRPPKIDFRQQALRAGPSQRRPEKSRSTSGDFDQQYLALEFDEQECKNSMTTFGFLSLMVYT